MSRLAVAYTGMLMKGRRVLTRWLPQNALSNLEEGPVAVAAIHRLVRRRLIPQSTEWVQVQQGFAKELWIQIDLASERSWWAGNHEPAVQETLRQIVGEDSVFYDVGAHIGFFSLPAGRRAAHVIAFEPDPENAARLRAHVVRNQLGERIEVAEIALWSETAPAIAFRTGNPRSQGGVAHENHQPVLATGSLIHVRAMRLDDFVSEGKPTPHIIKVDVEGAAMEVLSGAVATIRASRPTLIIELHTRAEYDGVVHFLEAFSYSVSWNIPPEGFPRQCLAFGASSSQST
jgi:FkbM family methyltransferase